jgi:kynurenine formamidase
MCHVCVIESVKARMDRRSFFRIAAAGAAAATVSSQPAEAQERTIRYRQVVDLTHTLAPDFPTYFGTPAYAREAQFTWAKDKFNLYTLSYGEHAGTHFDAPFHFSADGQSVDQIPLDKLVCPIAVIDVRAKAAADADYRVTPDDLKAFEAKNGRIPEGACVAMLSGWDAHLGTPKFRGEDASKTLHFPGFHLEAVDFLAKDRNVAGIAVDTLSLDHGPSKDFAVHYAWLGSGRYGIEAIANLAALPPVGATLVAGAPKFKGSSGGPGRVMAFM